MPESNQRRYLSHEHAKMVADHIERAIESCRQIMVEAGLERDAVDYEIMMGLARAAAVRGMNVWPDAVAPTNGHSSQVVTVDAPEEPISVSLTGGWGKLSGAASDVSPSVHIDGAGSLTDLAETEVRMLQVSFVSKDPDVRLTTRQWLNKSIEYLASLGLIVREVWRSMHTRAVRFRVSAG